MSTDEKAKFAAVLGMPLKAELQNKAEELGCSGGELVRFAVTYLLRRCARDTAFAAQVKQALGDPEQKVESMLDEPAPSKATR
jgi:hypothetical protein